MNCGSPISLLFCSLLPTFAWGASSPTESLLPNWFDPRLETFRPLPTRQLLPTRVPPAGFRVPAEYEPVGAVVLGWRGASSLLTEIARGVALQTDASVWAMGGPAAVSGVPSERYSSPQCNLDSIWVRDYGPVGLSLATGQPGLVDAVYRHYGSRPDDDAAPACLGAAMDLPVYGVELVLDGGNFLIDSAGNLFTTERVYAWNSRLSRSRVDELLRQTYSAREIHVLPYAGYPGSPADGTGHIDMFVKLLSDDTVLISEANEEPFRTAVNRAVDFFSSRHSPAGTPYRIFRVPGWKSNGTWYTYTNSLIVNGVALVPAYGDFPQANGTAREVYESAGLRVVSIGSDATIRNGGSIHCVTQTVPRPVQ